MGNNAAFTAWEAQVIALYNAGDLTLEMLDMLSEPYRGTDIDSGGSQDLTADDEKSIAEIVISLVNPGFVPNRDKNDWWDERDEFSEIRSQRWGWR